MGVRRVMFSLEIILGGRYSMTDMFKERMSAAVMLVKSWEMRASCILGGTPSTRVRNFLEN